MEGQAEAPRLLDQVRHVLRLHHYSIHTERSYLDWIKRYVHFHQMRCREDLVDGERKIEAFLTDLAVRGEGRCLDAKPGHECAGLPLPEGAGEAVGRGN